MDKSELTTDLRGPAEIREACDQAVRDMDWLNEVHDTPDAADRSDMVNAILNAIIAHSPSPSTVDELTRIRGAGE